MPQFDNITVAPIIISLIIILILFYYLTFVLMVKDLKVKKFRVKIKKLRDNPNLDNFLKLKDVIYFEDGKKKQPKK